MKIPLKNRLKEMAARLSGGFLIILVTTVSSEATSGTESTVDPLKAAEAVMAEWTQDPPSVPADWPHAQDINTASQAFLAWQAAMFEQRDAIRRKQTRLFYERMKVPPPPPTGQIDPEPFVIPLFVPLPIPTVRADSDPCMTRMDMPMPLPTDTRLDFSLGAPSVSFNLELESKTSSFTGASYKVGVCYSARDNEWMVADMAQLKTAIDAGPVKIAGTYQLHASRWSSAGAFESSGKGIVGTQLSLEYYGLKGSVGYNTQKEVSLAVGFDFAKKPKLPASLKKVPVGVEAEVSAPLIFHELTRGKRNLSSAIRRYSQKVVKLLTEPVDCPHCSARGQLDCPTCHNTRTVTCPKCNGKLHFTCTKCKGSGLVDCSACRGTGIVACHMCDGTGRQRCWTCGGSGQVTTYESQTEERQELVIDQIGFDDAGNPIYERHYETRTYTTQVPVLVTCSDCGGTGDGGQCSTCSGQGQLICGRCGGDGKVACRHCKGTGTIDCKACRGTGKITCPDCHGKPIQCPLCKGRMQLGK